MTTKKKRIGVMFGGRSAEHEISVITALQAISAIDTFLYDIIPIYIDKLGKWYTGNCLLEKQFYKNLPASINQAQEVTLLPDPTIAGIIPAGSNGGFAKQNVIAIDVYLLAFHGQYGEDGCIQGLLELADAAYTGCSVAASACAMDKQQSKMQVQAHGIAVLPSIVVKREDAKKDFAAVIATITSQSGLEQFPLFVKPNRLGSSVGISIAHDIESLKVSLAKAFKYDHRVLVEPCINEITEINIAVVDGEPPLVSVVEIPIASEKALTFEDKYLKGGSKSDHISEGMASLSRLINPKNLNPEIKEQVSKWALKAYSALNCSGVSRLDFIMDNATGNIFFNEINPVPGSFAFYLWEKTTPRLLYSDLIDLLINQAERKKTEKNSLLPSASFKQLMK